MEDLPNRLDKLTLAELARIATTDRSRYAADAIGRVEEELVRRGVTGLEGEGGQVRPLGEMDEAGQIYGGFWRRFAALWIDVVVLLPVTLLYLWADGHVRLLAAYWLIPGITLSVYYHVYLVRRFGGTPGKLAMGLCITKLDGLPVGYREAVLRSLPQLVIAECLGLGSIYASFQMTDAEVEGLTFMAKHARAVELAPAWFSVFTTANNIWVWSEFLVLLSNRKRRALHDFLAGTVVIRRRPTTT